VALILNSYFKKLNNFLFYLICLLPAALLTGSFFPDLIISLCSLIFLFILIVKKRNYFHNYFFYFFLIFWLILVTSSLLSKNPFFSLETSLFYIRFFIFSLSIYYLLIERLFNFKIFTNFLLFIILLLIFDSHFQYFSGYNILGFKLESPLRVSSFFRDELKMGSFLFRIFPILLILLFFLNNKKLYLFLIPAVFSSIILSGERTSIILSIIFFLGVVFFKIKFKEKILIISSLLLVLIIQFSFNNSFKYNFTERMKEEFVFEKLDNPTKELEKKFRFKFFTNLHTEMYNTSYEMFLDKKFFGHGPKMYRIICKEYDIKTCSTHPHSFVIQLLAETGIFGFLFYLVFFVFIIKDFFYFFLFKSINSNYVIILSLLIIINLFPLAPSGNFFNNWLNSIMYLPLGFYFFFRKRINV
jgi:O-antigen ligase